MISRRSLLSAAGLATGTAATAPLWSGALAPAFRISASCFPDGPGCSIDFAEPERRLSNRSIVSGAGRLKEGLSVMIRFSVLKRHPI